jgi:hypothetical protein
MPAKQRYNLAQLTREARTEAMDMLRSAHDEALASLPEPIDRAPLSIQQIRARYEKLTPEEMDVLAQHWGHQDTEQYPCEGCQLISYLHGLRQRREGASAGKDANNG